MAIFRPPVRGQCRLRPEFGAPKEIMSLPSSPIARMTKAYRHLERLTDIIRIMVKFGFGDLFDRLGLGDILVRARRLVGLTVTDSRPTRPRRLRQALSEMGVVFVKLGQYLSTRQDVLPHEYIEEFILLQDAIPPIDAAEVSRILAEELESDAVRDLSETPLAAASVGQVHAGFLADGREVVVKVRRPGLQKQIDTDLEILAELAEQADRHLSFLKFIHAPDLAAEFRRSLNSELNYRREAVNIERFGRIYARNPDVKIPVVHNSLCTENILVMERIKGLRIDEPQTLRQEGFDPTAVARLASRLALEQMVQIGLFHADPHPGNIVVQPGPTLAFMDFGLVGRLDRRTRTGLLSLARGVVRRNPAAVVRAMLSLVKPDEEPDREGLEMEVEVFLENHVTGALKNLRLGQILRDVLELMSQHQLRIPPNLLLMVKALSQYESLGQKLDPNFKFVEEAEPVVSRIYRRRLSPGFWLEVFSRHGLEALGFLENLPAELGPFRQMLKSGRLQGDLVVKDVDKLSQSINQASYRLSFALVLAALVIGSSVVIHAKLPPFWRGLPILGLAGFLGAGVVGFWLVWDFLRKYKDH
ncbi:MAG: hypothetical protein LBU12_04615 [Deltaproteobacteria bacterium]|jgi:ubiquinone biosynthesis protein|nr:hypothetical protein [Deltaproteobacteria bacterium]